MVCVLTRHPHIVEGLKNSRYIPLQRLEPSDRIYQRLVATAVEIMSLSMEDVCSFLEEQAEDSSSLQRQHRSSGCSSSWTERVCGSFQQLQQLA